MSVVGTKVHPPSLRRRLVERARLTDRLRGEVAHDARLVLVAAPAGFGKTTLLSQWLAGADSERNVAWLALDAGDNEVRRFLEHLVDAIQVTVPEAGLAARSVLDAGGTTPADAVLVSLVNDLDLIAGPLVVALDDYHVIDEAAVHQAVTFLLDNLPPKVTLAMTTRADPPLPLSRLRARGELVEVRAADLRFTDDETEAFLNDVMELQLEPSLVAALEARTEGWPAGLQLAALSARSHLAAAEGPGAVAAFVDDFSGSHRFVLDYLFEEVLNRQPGPIVDFLLSTSVLEQLTGELCDALTGGCDGQSMLETLDREHLFVVALDDDRRWYRYHQLFADALRSRLAVRQPERARELHAAASRWLAQQGMLRESIAHAAASGDDARTADLVELGIGALRRRRESSTIGNWLELLPDDVMRRRPLLALYTAWRHLSEGDLEGVATWLDAAEASGSMPQQPIQVNGPLGEAVRDRDDEMRSVAPMIAVYRASIAQAHGDVDGTIDHASRALALVGPQDHFPRGAASGFLGLALWAAGDIANAVDTFSTAVHSLQTAGMVADELGATVVLADMCVARGRPDQSRRILEDALASASELGSLPIVGDLHVGLAAVLCEHGELGAAAELLETARHLGDVGSLPENRHRWFVATAALLQATGDLEGAVRMLDEAEPLFMPGYFPNVRPVDAMRARVHVRQGRLDAARAWADGRGVTQTDSLSYLAEFDHLTLARLVIAEGDALNALGLLDRVIDAASATGRDGSVVEARMVRSLAHRAVDDPDSAMADLAAAISTAVPNGYRRLFLDEGPPMIGLLHSVVAAADPAVAELAEYLLEAVRRPTDSVAVPAVAASPDPLSERELEVLRLLNTELTGPEIAAELYVSVNTFRTHTKHIFTKLGVTTRRAAVRRAAELGLR